MSDKNVYLWSHEDNCPGGIQKDYGINDIATAHIFKYGLPIDQAMAEWKKKPEVKDPKEHFRDIVKRTLKWYQKPYPIVFEDKTSPKKVVEKYDLFGVGDMVIVNQRVLNILNNICPDSYEAFDVIIESMNGQVEGFKLLNITKRIFFSIDYENSLFSGKITLPTESGEYKKKIKVSREMLIDLEAKVKAGKIPLEELFRFINKNYLIFIKHLELKENCMGSEYLARMGEHTNITMLSKALINALHKHEIRGLKYEQIEERYKNGRNFI